MNTVEANTWVNTVHKIKGPCQHSKFKEALKRCMRISKLVFSNTLIFS